MKKTVDGASAVAEQVNPLLVSQMYVGSNPDFSTSNTPLCLCAEKVVEDGSGAWAPAPTWGPGRSYWLPAAD